MQNSTFLFAKKLNIVYNTIPLKGETLLKKPHYYFDMPQETYDFIIRKGILKESKKEKTILDLCLQGNSLKQIMIKTGYSMRTINYRKKDIFEKINKYFF